MGLICKIAFSVSISAFAIFSAKASACDYVNPVGSAADLVRIGKDILRTTELQALQNPARFCSENLKARYLGANKNAFAKLGVRTIRDPQYTNASEKLIQETEGDAWGMSLLPDKIARTEGLRRTSLATDIDSQTFNQFRPRSADQLSREAALFSSISHNGAPSASGALGGVKTGALEFAACAQMSLFGAGSCVSALKVVERQMMPQRVQGVANSSLTNARGWKELFSSTHYENGIRIAAQRMQAAIKTNRFAASDNVFDLMVDSFQKGGGFSQAQGKDAAFLVMGVLANGGPNMMDRIRGFENPQMTQLGQSLSYIASAMPVLDTLKAERGMPLFSLPKEVKASCDNSKPYHFWLSAALTHDLVVKDRIDPKTAATATFIAQKAYQVAREVGGSGKSDGLAKTLSQQPFSPVSQVIRADLAYSSSGAFFGANQAAGKVSHINLDDALRSLVRDAAIEPAPDLADSIQLVNDHKIQAFRTWDRIFSPNSAFDMVRKSNPL